MTANDFDPLPDDAAIFTILVTLVVSVAAAVAVAVRLWK